jgi:hypothetical protein
MAIKPNLGTSMQDVFRLTHVTGVIVAGASLDRALEEVFVRAYGPFADNVGRKVLDGPLYSTHNRTLLLYALKLIDKPTFEVLAKFRALRNLFAHSTDILDFDMPAVQDHLIGLGWKSGDKLNWFIKRVDELSVMIKGPADGC